MPESILSDMRRLETIVGQIQAMYMAVDRSRNRADMRAILNDTIRSLYPRFDSLAKRYNIPPQEIKKVDDLYRCCIDEDFYQGYKSRLAILEL